MLTSTEAASSRKFEISLRDAVDSKQVDAFMDSVVQTLMHYERHGRLHPQGISAEEVSGTRFRPANGQGYNVNGVERLRLAALEAIRFYEASISGGGSLQKAETRVGRISQQAPHATLAQNGYRAASTYAATANDFRPPGQTEPTHHYPIDFDVPILEDTISVPIRRPEVSGTRPNTVAEPALLTAEMAQILYEAQPMHPYMIHQTPSDQEYERQNFQVPVQTVVQAPTVTAARTNTQVPAPTHSVQTSTSATVPVADSASTQRTGTPEQSAAPHSANATPQSASAPHRANATTQTVASPASGSTTHQQATASAGASPTTAVHSTPESQTIDYRLYSHIIGAERQASQPAPNEHKIAAAEPHRPAQPLSTPRATARPNARTAAKPNDTDVEEIPDAIDVLDLLQQLNNIMRTKESLAKRDPQNHSLHSTIRLSTSAGPLEVTAVRLQNNGQIYLETKPGKLR